MEREYKFRALTSNKDVEIKPVTLKALEFAIDENSEVTNVAITGNYGAGKSSVVDSFELKCKNKKFIHISLGQYDETESSEKNGLDKREINTIEGKIINQLLHQIDPNKIRKSIFKTIDTESQISPLKITVYLGLIILLSLYLFNISLWYRLVKNFSWLFWTTKPIISLIALAILFVLIVYGIFHLSKLQRDFGFIKKLSLKASKIETGIEIFSNESSRISYFDRYLDDVLYLFKQSGANVIVFEDIERFNNSKIFEKLKELNIVINRKRKICGDSKLVFFYLVKDDLFESQERTKFFDYIIPIVPVVTASNSNEILKELLTEMREYDSLDKTFLFNISLYLDDMRLINNVCNEYLTYKETLSKLPLESEKIFSMVVYKNIFPKDFSLLQKNQGYLFELLNSKEIALKNRREELNSKIKKLEKKIEKADEEQLNDELELYGTILKVPPGRKVIEVNSKSESDFSSRSDYIRTLLADDSEIITFQDYWYADNNQYKRIEDIDSIFPDINTPEFQERLENIRNKKLIEKLEKEIKKMNDELGKLDSYRLSDIYQYASDIDNFKSNLAEEIKNNPQFSIISFLIRNAYIDESYQDYLTYFYENTITVVEKEYLRNVISGRTNDPGIILHNMTEIIDRLGVNDFRYPYVLNYTLFRYLLVPSDSSNFKNELELLFHQEGFIKFIMDFYFKIYNYNQKGLINDLESDKIYQSLFETWISYNSNLFNEYLETDNKDFFPLKNNIVIKLLNIVDTNFLENISQRTKYLLTNYIDNNFDILTGEFKYNLPRLTENLRTLDIKFTNFSTYGTKKERIQEEIVSIVDGIFLNKLYTINENNIRFFMNWYSGYTDEQFKHQNFEIISSNSLFESLLDYCLSSDEEFLKYILMYVTLSEGEMRDKPEYIEQLLNNNVVFNHQLPQEKLGSDKSDDLDNDENIKKGALAEKIIASIPEFYITYTQDKFNDLSSENREILVNNLVITQKAEVNTEIVLDYFSQNEDEDNFLIDFINQNPNFEFDKEIYLRFDDEVQEKFEEYIIQSKKLQKNIRKKVLNATGDRYYEKFSEIGMSESQLEKLTDDNLIEFNRLNLEFFRKEYPSSLANFIWNNIKDYLNDERDIRDEEQLLELIARYDLKMEEDIRIRIFLLNNHFDDSNFEYLLPKEIYEKVENELQVEIQNIVKKYIRQFIELDENEISFSLYEEILNADDVSNEHKKKLFEKLIYNSENRIKLDKLAFLANYLDLLELSDIMQILNKQIDDAIYDEWKHAFEELNDNEGNGGNGNQKTEVTYSEFNEKLLTYLKKRELISDKSRREDSILQLFGFRSKQIEFKDILEENNE